MRWQYKTLKFKARGFLGGKLDESEVIKALNELGDQGWELVSALSANQGQGATRDVFFFLKRSN